MLAGEVLVVEFLAIDRFAAGTLYHHFSLADRLGQRQGSKAGCLEGACDGKPIMICSSKGKRIDLHHQQ
jgi:hypothetical protein